MLPTGAGKEFGDVFQDVEKAAYAAGEAVSVVFHAGCPRNNLHLDGTFLTGGLEQKEGVNAIRAA